MKVTIKGTNPVTSEQFKSVIDTLNEKYQKHGVVVKNMTCYIRFVNEEGEIVEPVDEYGNAIESSFVFKKTITVTDDDETPRKKKRRQKIDTDLKLVPGGKSK